MQTEFGSIGVIEGGYCIHHLERGSQGALRVVFGNPVDAEAREQAVAGVLQHLAAMRSNDG